MLLEETRESQEQEELKQYLLQLPEKWDSDIFIFSKSIYEDSVNDLMIKIKNNPNKRNNVSLLLTTDGGSGNAAFRMARFLKKEYDKFIIFVFGRCKSSGTIVAIGANEIVMSDFGELGPIDVQLYKKDDLGRESGLNLKQCFKLVREEVPKVFEDCLSKIHSLDPNGEVITLKVMEDIAAHIAKNLLKPILVNIEPARLGEIDRETRVAIEYGERLNKTKKEAITKLASEYPSHGFVIDFQEASELFGQCVRKPNTEEEKLEQYLQKYEFDRMRSQPDFELGFIGNLEDFLTKDSMAKNY
jgi:hypothetical protein